MYVLDRGHLPPQSSGDALHRGRQPGGSRLHSATVLPRLHAAWILAWSLVFTLLRRRFLPRSYGLARFQANYAGDRLLPLSAEERRLLPALSRCTACGLCNSGQSAAIAASAGAYGGMMPFVLSASRSIPDFDAAAAALEHVSVGTLAALEPLCPVRIPFRNLAAFVRAKADAMQR